VDVDVSVPEVGALTLSLDDTKVDLGEARYNRRSDSFTARGLLPLASVTDTRPANPGWSLVGKSSDFSGGDGESIAAKYLGWTPELVKAAEGQQVTPGESRSAGSGIGDGASLASAAAGAGRGTAQVGAILNLRAPVTTKPGDYRSTITLTLS